MNLLTEMINFIKDKIGMRKLIKNYKIMNEINHNFIYAKSRAGKDIGFGGGNARWATNDEIEELNKINGNNYILKTK